jgi:hypothetical protein
VTAVGTAGEATGVPWGPTQEDGSATAVMGCSVTELPPITVTVFSTNLVITLPAELAGESTEVISRQKQLKPG